MVRTLSRSVRPGRAGASARVEFRARWRAGRRGRLAVLAFAAGVVGVGGAVAVGWRVGLLLAVLVGAAVAVGQWRGHEAVRTWRRGAAGERRTARRLAVLSSMGYLVLHDRALPRGRANVDHLVIGPCGVFVVDSKNWSKERRITTRGRRVQIGRRHGEDEVRSAAYEARAVAAALSTAVGARVEVTPLLAVYGPFVPWRGLVVDGVRMLRGAAVTPWILRRGRRLDGATVARLQQVAPVALPPYLGSVR